MQLANPANDNRNLLTQASARALCEAGLMPLVDYLALCEKNGWK
jgi:hypothetical protein